MALTVLIAITLACIAWSLWIRRVTWSCRWEVAATLNIALQGLAVLLMSPWASETIGHVLYGLTGKWNLEDYLGHGKYLLFYLVGGVVAALFHMLSGPSSQMPTIGASGAIAAVMGAYFFLYPRAKVQTLVFFIFITSIRIPAWIFLGVWFVMQLFEGTYGAAQGVAVWAHVGGFLFGVLAAWIASRRRTRSMDYYA